ncbi:GNAT family N-acetyltransferase [Paracoccus caeni]|uniref:GNAT family N-acetyltransferase n=1 Tax=Paracoccus caeni TaxID=657651 RepID=A0A934VVB0_9RHOB|nr:GNAT family N-acetyltransferase [Paracoccus caeni]MBK4216736.1 GNAT family N-acetyltransferase [Paracoccus caeni]
MSDHFVVTSPLDPRAAPLVEDLIREYDQRYGTLFSTGGAREEVFRYPPDYFAAPNGTFLLLIRDGETIGGGAFMRYDDDTAEFKRIWTRADLRRQGLAQRIVTELEAQAVALGYTRVYLTTGFRQPEAKGLYLGLGYRPLFDPDLPPELYATLPFEKHIGALAGRPGSTPLKQPAENFEAAAKAAVAAKVAKNEQVARQSGEIRAGAAS